ncbi:hypothetical protein L596_024491 [Steinernema carpocapsae]|uniref:Uncharacterized protein n=1 Tax=Steinernema carpocapsae TaxID=34508 RepID=A0A4U5MGY1_STECR|nr:hypothetical protein L596_024491 [Steinernema carpocapsae]
MNSPVTLNASKQKEFTVPGDAECMRFATTKRASVWKASLETPCRSVQMSTSAKTIKCVREWAPGASI